MKIIHRLTLRCLQLNKRRTLVTVIGAVLSVTMLAAVSIGLTSFTDLMRRHTITSTGEWHVRYEGVNKKQIDAIRRDFNTGELLLSEDIGFSPLEGSKNEYKPYLFLSGLSQSALEKLPIHLLEGRLPQNENEVVISSHIKTNGGVDYQVGDVLDLHLGKRVWIDEEVEFGKNGLDNTTLFQLNEETGAAKERLEPLREKQVTVVGICERTGLEDYSAPGYRIFSLLDEETLSGYSSASAWVISRYVSNGLYQSAEELGNELGIHEIDFNDTLLEYYGVTDNPYLRTMLLSVVTAVLTIIVIGSVSLIYNAFSISVSERSRWLGMVASVGATRSQKRSSVLFEGLLIGAVSIPFGLLFAFIGMEITFWCISPMFGNVFGIEEPLRAAVSWETVLLTVGMTALTIWLSTRAPARRASRISPIDAIRQTGDVKLKSRQVRTAKLTRRLLGFEGDLALKNLKRNKKRYRTTVFSIALSVILFISVSSLMSYAQTSITLRMGEYSYDLQLNGNCLLSDAESKNGLLSFYGRAAAMNEIQESAVTFSTSIDLLVPAELMPEAAVDAGIADKSGQGRYLVTLYAMEDAALERAARAAGVSPEAFRDTASLPVLVVNAADGWTAENKRYTGKALDLRGGDRLKVSRYDEQGNESIVCELTAAGELSECPFGTSRMREAINAFTVITSVDVLEALAAKAAPDSAVSCDMVIKSSDPNTLAEELQAVIEEEELPVYLHNAYADYQEEQQTKTIYAVFLYGFVCLISLICAANIFNTVSTGVALRRREVAMLRSVGMTKKQFHKMLRLETLLYGLKGMLYGLPAAVLVSWVLYQAFRSGFEFPFALPWREILLAVIAAFAVVGVTMLYAGNRLKRDGIIDTLRQENI